MQARLGRGHATNDCNPEINQRGFRFPEFPSLNNLKVVNTLGPNKPSTRWTWHSPGGDYHNQIDYIMVKRRFQSSVKIAKTRSIPGDDIGRDHELVMMINRLRLRREKNRGNARIRFSLEKLKDLNIAEIFRGTKGGKLAPLHALDNQDTETDALINSSNTAVTETANNILGKHRPAKKPWVTDNLLKLCYNRSDRSQKKNTTEGAKLYRKVNSNQQKRHEKSKGDLD